MTAEEAFAEAMAELEKLEHDRMTFHSLANVNKSKETRMYEALDMRYWCRGNEFCPTCGVHMAALNPMANIYPHFTGACKEPEPPLRILPADDTPKTEAGTFGVVLGFLMIGATMLTLAGMKVWDIAWRVMR